MKKILIPICLLIAALAAVPFVNGMVAEKLAYQMADNVNRMYAQTCSDLRFSIDSYDRGLLDSRIRWQIDLGGMASVYPVDKVVFTERATHGLLGVESQTDLLENPWFADWVEKRQGGKNPLNITTRYPAFGPIISRITLTPFTVETPKKPLNVDAMEMTVTIEKDFSRMSYNGTWKGMNEDENNRLGQVEFDADLTRVTDMIWAGKGSASLAQFTASGNNSPVNVSGVDVTDVVMDFELAVSDANKNMDVEMGMQVGSVTMNGVSHKNWIFRLGIGAMDLKAYEELVTLYSKVVNQALAQAATPVLDAAGTDLAMKNALTGNAPQLMAALEKMLKKDFHIRIPELDITLPQGQITGNFHLGLKKDMTIAGFLPLMMQPSHALKIFTLKSDVTVPTAMLVGNANLTVPMLPGMTTGLFVVDGATARHQAETKDGKLYINGSEVTLP
ncbi:MAG: YdgA family protein [Desulfobacterales bacterium]|nr:YdgA family protein [Desulfobacterales bacterium]